MSDSVPLIITHVDTACPTCCYYSAIAATGQCPRCFSPRLRQLIDWADGRKAERRDMPAMTTTPAIKTGRTLVRLDQPADPPWIDRSHKPTLSRNQQQAAEHRTVDAAGQGERG